MDEQKIQSAFKAEGIEKEIKCPEAFAISEKYGISKTDISEYPQYSRGKDPVLPAGLLQMSPFFYLTICRRCCMGEG